MMETIIWYFEFNLDGRKDDRRIEMKKFLYSRIIYSDFHSNSLVSIYLNSSRENFLHKFIWYWMSTEISVCDCTLRYCVFCINYSRISTSKRSFLALFATPLVFSHSSHISRRMNFLFIFFYPWAFRARFPFFPVDSLPFIVSNSSLVAFATRIGSQDLKRTGRAERQQYFPEKFELHFSGWRRERRWERIPSILSNIWKRIARVADDLNLLHVLV